MELELQLRLQLARVEEPFDLLDIHDSTAPWAILKLVVRSGAFNCAMLTSVPPISYLLPPTSPSASTPFACIIFSRFMQKIDGN